MKRKADARRFGFTLIEIVLAIAILAAIGLALANALSATVQFKDVLKSASDEDREIQAAFTRLVADIRQGYISERYDARRYRDYIERPTQFIGEESTLLLTSFSHRRKQRDAKESDQVVIEYKLSDIKDDGDSNTTQALVRRFEALPVERMDQGGSTDVLVRHVVEFELKYWDSVRRDWVSEWSTKSLERKSNLPARVRIQLTIEPPGGTKRTYVTQVRPFLTQELPLY